MRKFLRVVAIVFGLIAMISATLVLGAWLTGRIVSDRYGWSQWLLWIPTPAALSAVMVGMLAASRPVRRSGVRRRRFLRWAASGAAVLFYFTVIEHRFFRFPAGYGPSLRIVHWNMTHEKRGQANFHVNTIIELNGDVTILSTAGTVPGSSRLLNWMGDHSRPVSIYPFTILTRLPILEARALIANDEIRVALFRVDASDVLGRSLIVYAIDLPSNRKKPRAEVARRARRLLDQADAPPPDIVVGDFNMTHGSASVHMLFPHLQHAFDQAGHGYGATFPRAFPLYHLDHTLLAETLRATDYRIVDPSVGRHRIQVVQLIATE